MLNCARIATAARDAVAAVCKHLTPDSLLHLHCSDLGSIDAAVQKPSGTQA